MDAECQHVIQQRADTVRQGVPLGPARRVETAPFLWKKISFVLSSVGDLTSGHEEREFTGVSFHALVRHWPVA